LGEVQLPSKDEMNEDTEREKQKKSKLGIPERQVGSLNWQKVIFFKLLSC
jgi:hypothetical protein